MFAVSLVATLGVGTKTIFSLMFLTSKQNESLSFALLRNASFLQCCQLKVLIERMASKTALRKKLNNTKKYEEHTILNTYAKFLPVPTRVASHPIC